MPLIAVNYSLLNTNSSNIDEHVTCMKCRIVTQSKRKSQTHVNENTQFILDKKCVHVGILHEVASTRNILLLPHDY